MHMISTLSNNLYCMQCYSIFSFECNLISQKKKHKFFLSCLNEVLTIYKFVCGSVFLQAFKPTHGWHSALSPATVFCCWFTMASSKARRSRGEPLQWRRETDAALYVQHVNMHQWGKRTVGDFGYVIITFQHLGCFHHAQLECNQQMCTQSSHRIHKLQN